MRKVFLLFVAVAFFAACNTNPKDEAVVEEKIMTVDDLFANIENLVDSNVIVQGEVDHVCKHGGTKMVIFNPETDNSIHIDASEKSGNFRADEVANQTVTVWGKVEEFRVDDAYVESLQAELDELITKGGETEELAEKTDETKKAVKHGDGGAPDKDGKHKLEIEQRVNQINNLKTELDSLKAIGKNHISYYSVRCDKYEVAKDTEETAPKAE